MIKLIVAMTKDRVIAKDDAIPWHYTEDMRRFRRLTLKQTVIMGRKTWDSLPRYFRPLRDRLNIIISRANSDESYDFPNVILLNSLVGAIRFTKEHLPPNRDTWIMGGGEIYKEALENPEINVEHLDIVTVPDIIPPLGATLFPEIDLEKWIETAHYKSGDLIIQTYRKG